MNYLINISQILVLIVQIFFCAWAILNSALTHFKDTQWPFVCFKFFFQIKIMFGFELKFEKYCQQAELFHVSTAACSFIKMDTHHTVKLPLQLLRLAPQKRYGIAKLGIGFKIWNQGYNSAKLYLIWSVNYILRNVPASQWEIGSDVVELSL